MAIYAIGDIHGSVQGLMDAIGNMEQKPGAGDALLCLGDVGVRYGSQTNGPLLRCLSSLPCDVLVMRGNHDARYCRDLRAGALGDGRGRDADWRGAPCMVDPQTPNVYYLRDYGGVIDVDGHRCLYVPGAWSIDGAFRRMFRMPCEPAEQLSKKEMRRVMRWAQAGPVEHVFSHTCPHSWFGDLADLLLPVRPGETDNTMEMWMDELLEAVRPSLRGWWFGHFHDARDVAGGIGHMLYRDVRRVL